MTPTLPAPIWEYFAAFQIFRNLGFSSDDIHFSLWKPSGDTAATLRSQGKEFMAATGTLAPEEIPFADRFLEELEVFARNEAAEAVKVKYHATEIYRNRLLLIGALLQDGFRFPYKQN